MRALWRIGAATMATMVATTLGTTVAVGDPKTETPHLVSEKADGDQKTVLTVYSAAMKKAFPIEVLLPPQEKKPSPVLYLLNGAGGGEDIATWGAQTDYRKFFKKKNVYVITPIGGKVSYYTDWLHRDPHMGQPLWQTFLTEELPPVIAKRFNTTGLNAIGGISMAGTSVFNLAIHKPSLYKAIAAFSGCARTSDWLGQQYIKLVVDRGEGNIENMWGPVGGPGWIANDPYIQAAKLRGMSVYMTAGSGMPGEFDNLSNPDMENNPWMVANQIVAGGGIEAGVNVCTREVSRRLTELNIPHTLTIRPTGTHSWRYWQVDLHQTWPKLAKDLKTN